MKNLVLFTLLVLSGVTACKPNYESDATEARKGMVAFMKGNYALALVELEHSSKKGNPVAQAQLGAMYDLGRGVTENDAEAERWYTLSAEQGFSPAQYNLGMMFRERGQQYSEYSRESRKWHKESVTWIELAAEQGNANALMALGGMYEDGLFVIEDHETALSLYSLAAEQGDMHAMYMLGSLYKHAGSAVEDKSKSYMWFNIAASNGDMVAKTMKDSLS